MARPLMVMLREAAVIKGSSMLNDQQKAHALSMLQKEIDAATGQQQLIPEAGTGGVPPAPQSTPSSGRKA